MKNKYQVQVASTVTFNLTVEAEDEKEAIYEGEN
jgi:hypothetical protein